MMSTVQEFISKFLAASEKKNSLVVIKTSCKKNLPFPISSGGNF
jgi:hypothetical protein